MKDWINIISFTYPHEAHLAKAFLEAHDIEVIIKDELTVQMHNFLSNAIGGVKIFVEKDKSEEALSLLEEGGYIDKNPSEEPQKIEVFSSEYKNICPYCGGANIVRKNLPGYTFALSILLLGFPIPFLKRVHYCYDCTREWKVK